MSHIFQRFVLPHFYFSFCQEVAALPHPPRSILAVESVPGKKMMRHQGGIGMVLQVPKSFLNKWISTDVRWSPMSSWAKIPFNPNRVPNEQSPSRYSLSQENANPPNSLRRSPACRSLPSLSEQLVLTWEQKGGDLSPSSNVCHVHNAIACKHSSAELAAAQNLGFSRRREPSAHRVCVLLCSGKGLLLALCSPKVTPV